MSPFRRGRSDDRERRGKVSIEKRSGGGEEAKCAWTIPQDCRERRLVSGAGAAALERKDPCSGETPLVSQVQLDEYENAKRLLQAGADANAATAGGERALLIAAKEGREDLVELLAGFQAEVDGCDANGKTALIWASEGGHFAAAQLLLKVGADIKAKDKDGRTSLHLAGILRWCRRCCSMAPTSRRDVVVCACACCDGAEAAARGEVEPLSPVFPLYRCQSSVRT